MLLNSVATTRPGTGLVLAEAVDFDGANDYLSRSSDLTGNADGKTFTFSAWVWLSTADSYYLYQNTGGRVRIQISSGEFSISLKNSGGTTIVDAGVALKLPEKTWVNIIVSLDTSSTGTRSIYINDVPQSVTYSVYTVNGVIDFTETSHSISPPTNLNPLRLSHVFLDYTYRNLSIEANRRLFITADRKPTPKATLSALNPILYLPMDDPTTAHINLGTGGNFTLNGVIARSGRGANQFNAPYSDLDGAADYLSRGTGLTGSTDTSTFTFHCVINPDTAASSQDHILTFNTGSLITFAVRTTVSGQIQILGYNSSNTILLNMTTAAVLVAGRNAVLTASLDLSNTSNRKIYVNGVDVTSGVTWTQYNSGQIYLTVAPINIAANNQGTVGAYFDGRCGNIFFHTSYIDLSVAANLAKFVTGTGIDAKPVDMGANGELPLGVQPLIYLPMYGNNAGKNYGSGGDFTVNSGPYTGARGPNEYWGNKADFDGSTGYLARTSALTGVSDGKTFSASFFIEPDNSSTTLRLFYIDKAAGNFNRLGVYRGTDNNLYFSARNSANTQILNAVTTSASFTNGSALHVLVCIDLANSSNRRVYINGVSETMTWTTYTNDTIELSSAYQTIGALWNGSAYSVFHNGKLSEFYFTTDYIDFSQESNRLKFRDAFGNPADLTPQIQAGTLPNPAIYMRFDPADQGKNSGTGGNFTKTGTISDGGQL